MSEFTPARVVALESEGKVVGETDVILIELLRVKDVSKPCHNECSVKKEKAEGKLGFSAGPTRLELATFGVTGRRSNQTELRPQKSLKERAQI